MLFLLTGHIALGEFSFEIGVISILNLKIKKIYSFTITKTLAHNK